MKIEEISEAMKALNWTSEDLAVRSGVRARTIDRLLAGQIAHPQVRTLRGVETALDKARFNRSIDASGAGLLTLTGDVADLSRVILWFKTLTAQNQMLVIESLAAVADLPAPPRPAGDSVIVKDKTQYFGKKRRTCAPPHPHF